MRRCVLPLCLLSLLTAPAALHAGTNFPGGNDFIFPAQPSARAAISFDGRGFVIRGRRTFLAAAEVQYSRIPRALWKDRLLRAKRAGYNAIQTYAYWSYHEPAPGQFEFSGEKDFSAFLSLVHSLGMYAVVRVGPYVNGEWDSGGWPIWLRFIPGLQVETAEPQYLAALDRWMGKLMPLVAAQQVQRGGPVVMVQLANEDGRDTGTDLNGPYFTHLHDLAVRHGIAVPMFFSGLNHGDDPAGGEPWEPSARPSPWYSSEFWTGWFDRYGETPDSLARQVRGTWKVLAYGGAGFSHYTVTGGSNFDTSACDIVSASYDFGSPVGQGGGLRAGYFLIKRANLFAQSFPQILANARNSTSEHQADAPGVRVTARTGPQGTIVFLDNQTPAPVTTQPAGSSVKMTLAPFEIAPVVEDAPIAPGVTLKRAFGRILGVQRERAMTTLVLYGAPGEQAEITFTVPRGSRALRQRRPAITIAGTKATLAAPFPSAGVDAFALQAGPQIVRVLLVRPELADRTWFLEDRGHHAVVIGPDFVGDAAWNGRWRLSAEQSASGAAHEKTAWIFDEQGTSALPLAAPKPLPAPPALTRWATARGDSEAQPAYADAAWRKSADPLPMGADGDIGAYAWYRATVHAPRAAAFALDLSDAGDWVTAFVDGKRAASSDVVTRFDSPVSRSLPITLSAGDHQIALMAAHYGRNKLYSYAGPFDQIDRKGVSGPVTLASAPTATLSVDRWRWKRDDRGEASASEMAAAKTDGPGWGDASIGQDVFNQQGGFAWWRATLPDAPGAHHTLHFGAVDDNATVYLNGQRLFHNVGWNVPFAVPLDAAWKAGGPNELAVLVENTAGGGSISQPVRLTAVPDGAQTPITGWRMRGGVTRPAASAWTPLGASLGVPTFYRAHFQGVSVAESGPRPILRVTFAGLSRGFVWLNGHNLGRYPEKTPTDSIYLPECWVRPGENEIMIFDEEGSLPTGVRLFSDPEAGRTGVILTGKKG